MNRELIISICAEGEGSSIYRETLEDGTARIVDIHSSMIGEIDDDYIPAGPRERYYDTFEDFWNHFIKYRYWYRLYFLDVHPDDYDFIKTSVIEEYVIDSNIPPGHTRYDYLLWPRQSSTTTLEEQAVYYAGEHVEKKGEDRYSKYKKQSE